MWANELPPQLRPPLLQSRGPAVPFRAFSLPSQLKNRFLLHLCSFFTQQSYNSVD